MTSKCKTCGHEYRDHWFEELEQPCSECNCEKFQPEDDFDKFWNSKSTKKLREKYTQKKGCKHKWVGSNIAGIVNCLFCGESNDLRESQGGES